MTAEDFIKSRLATYEDRGKQFIDTSGIIYVSDLVELLNDYQLMKMQEMNYLEQRLQKQRPLDDL